MSHPQSITETPRNRTASFRNLSSQVPPYSHPQSTNGGSRRFPSPAETASHTFMDWGSGQSRPQSIIKTAPESPPAPAASPAKSRQTLTPSPQTASLVDSRNAPISPHTLSWTGGVTSCPASRLPLPLTQPHPQSIKPTLDPTAPVYQTHHRLPLKTPMDWGSAPFST